MQLSIVSQQSDSVNSNNITESVVNHVCAICVEEKDNNLFELVTQNCKHANIVCSTCVANHIITQFESYGKVDINCPNCDSVFQGLDIKRFVSEEYYKRYELISFKVAHAKVKDFHYCLQPKCNFGQLHVDKESPIMTCNNCSRNTCLKHTLPLKPNVNCRMCELDRTATSKISLRYFLKLSIKIFSKKPEIPETPKKQANREERSRLKHLKKANIKSKRFINWHTKPCPHCGARIQKTGGCSHMRCLAPGCNKSFSW
ncbi:6237_t:CDS:2 [Ambispora gerdemannii]|uniref:RBR-type E3 ubiquitin transferase n=1 Tax=Ambispora gerdemannii TaxID=144530 RepID=A0A9N8V674_9GLOM|nr:6237_t:CDS:2 [Ambispora gerdemannii]